MIDIKKKFVYLLVCLLILYSVTGTIIYGKTPVRTLNTINASQNYTHTVFIGVASAQVCGPCHNWSNNVYNTYVSGDYEFEYASMIAYDENGQVLNYDAEDWSNNYSISTFPTTILDGDYQRITGDHIEQLPDALDSCGNRTVADITANVTVSWLGNATINVAITIQNNEGSQYNGSIHVFITEIISRYETSQGDSFHFGFLDFAFEENISINVGNTHTDSIIWNGNDHEDAHGDDFGDITANNIQVALVV